MAIIYRNYSIGNTMADTLKRKGIPFEWQGDKKHSYTPGQDSVKIVTMHSSKGLEFPLVCIPAIGAASKHDGEPEEEARLLYVAMTRATQELVMTYGEESLFSEKMQKAMTTLNAM